MAIYESGVQPHSSRVRICSLCLCRFLLGSSDSSQNIAVGGLVTLGVKEYASAPDSNTIQTRAKTRRVKNDVENH